MSVITSDPVTCKSVDGVDAGLNVDPTLSDLTLMVTQVLDVLANLDGSKATGPDEIMYQSIPKLPIPPPRAIPGHLTRIKFRTVGNLTQNEARPVGHLTFVSIRLSAVRSNL